MEHDRLFDGEIGRTVDQSRVSWTSKPSQLKQRPNIVMIVLDDVGYSQLGCYGSDIETPALDSLAADGLRYANFHVTPLCSPTRTCLLTGRNHHSVGMGPRRGNGERVSQHARLRLEGSGQSRRRSSATRRIPMPAVSGHRSWFGGRTASTQRARRAGSSTTWSTSRRPCSISSAFPGPATSMASSRFRCTAPRWPTP